MYLGKNIKYLSKQLKINQMQLSEKIGFGQSTISGWITGGSFPDYQTLLKLREIFDINLHEFIYTDLSSKVILSDNGNNVHEPQTEYKKSVKDDLNNHFQIEIIESERQLYERIIKSKDETIEVLKTQIENLKK